MKSKLVQLCVIGVLIAGLASVAQAQMFITDSTPLTRFGPVDPSTGYPIWAEDALGNQLELCFDTTAIPDPTPGCCATCPPTDPAFCPPCPTCIDPALDLPFPNEPLSFPNNFPEEAFYYSLNALMDTNNGGRTLLVLALEAAFDGLGTVQAGEQIVFSRLRLRIDNAEGGQEYTITHPYGQVIVTADGAGPRGINLTNDVFLWKGTNLVNPLRANFGTFATAAGGTVPPGFLGDFCDVNTLNAPTVMNGAGMPMAGHNVFRIEGPNIGEVGNPFLCADPTLGPDPVATTDCIETDLFAIVGKAPTKFGAGIDRATYSRDATATQIDVWANSNSTAMLEVSGPGIPATAMIPDPANPGHFYAHIVISSGFALPVDWNVSVTNLTDGITATAPLIDQVKFLGTGAPGAVGCGPTFDLNATNPATGLPSPTLSIAATSTNVDTAASLSTGTGAPLGAGGAIDILDVTVPPISVSVASPSGGTVEMPVQILSTVTGPLAFAGLDQIVPLSDPNAVPPVVTTVTLDGTGSSGDMITYSWSQIGGTPVTLSSTAAPQTTFTYPSANDFLTFQLTVTDSLGMINSSLVTVTNEVIAHAGLDISSAPQGTLQLNGTASGFAPLAFSWAQTTGPAVTLSDPTSATPTFVFPVNGAGVVGAAAPNDEVITFALTVSGVGGTSVDTVVISGPPGPPIADAGPNQTILINSVAQLDGGASVGTITTYAWSQLSGNAVQLGVLLADGSIDFAGDLNRPDPVFFFPGIPQTMTFQLIVTGPGGVSAASTVDITAGSPFTPDVLTIDPNKAQYDSGKLTWGIEGTSSMAGPGHSVAVYLGAPVDANLIASAPVDGGGKFKIQSCMATCPDPTVPGAPQTLTAISTLGGVLTDVGFSIK